jgi:predicted nucleic acid-binding protein
MILVDSSSWIHMLRPNGDAAVRNRVVRALETGEACWCPIIRLELWNGAGGDREKKVLREFERVLPELAIDQAVWTRAFDLARRARSAGLSPTATDMLIIACAQCHRAGIEHSDSDFSRLENI